MGYHHTRHDTAVLVNEMIHVQIVRLLTSYLVLLFSINRGKVTSLHGLDINKEGPLEIRILLVLLVYIPTCILVNS